MDVVNGSISLSTGVLNGIDTSLSNGVVSLIDIVISFVPLFLTITVSFFAIRFLLRLFRFGFRGKKYSDNNLNDYYNGGNNARGFYMYEHGLYSLSDSKWQKVKSQAMKKAKKYGGDYREYL